MTRQALLACFAFWAALSAAPVLADTRDDIEADILRCHAIADDRTWLNCVYGAAQPMRARLGLPPAPQASMSFSTDTRPALPVPRSPDPGVPEQQFGIPVPDTQASAMPRNVTQIHAPMTSYSFDRYGIFTVILADGQVWRQESGDTEFAQWHKPAPSYVVDISHGAFGSYNLKVDHMTGSFKVKRIR